MSMIPIEAKDYSDGRTKQSFAESTDINKILKKAQKAGTLSHLVKHGAHYGDFSDVPDLLTAHERIKAGQAIYDDLPSELRKEFPDQFAFFEYVNDPNNLVPVDPDDPTKGVQLEPGLLQRLAEPGRQVPAVRRTAATEANPAVASAEPESAPVEAPVEPDASSTT